jgi:hypothetical protein
MGTAHGTDLSVKYALLLRDFKPGTVAGQGKDVQASPPAALFRCNEMCRIRK